MRLAKDKEVNQLIKLIKEVGLDADRLTHDKFTSTVKLMEYHPTKYNGNASEFEGMESLSIGSQIYQVFPNEHDIVLTKEQLIKFNNCVNEEMKSERFKKEFKNCYNSFTFEVTVYSEAFLNFMGGKWYNITVMDEKLPLNASKEREEELKAKATAEGERIMAHMRKNGHNVKGFEVKKNFIDTHFRKEEWNEIKELCEKSDSINPRMHPTHQSSRRLKENTNKESLKNYKEVTLKSTGRKMLFHVYTYGWSFIEIDPVVV